MRWDADEAYVLWQSFHFPAIPNIIFWWAFFWQHFKNSLATTLTVSGWSDISWCVLSSYYSTIFLIEQTAGGLLSLSSYFRWAAACVISAGCIKSDAALQQIDPPSSRHENTAMASARTGVYMCECVCLHSCILACKWNHSVRKGFSFSVGVYGGVCTWELTPAEERL